MSAGFEIVPPVTVRSPCVNICTIAGDGYCAGCARTLDEIARWTRMSESERETIMAALPGRRGNG